jgi:hypothetical protein
MKTVLIILFSLERKKLATQVGISDKWFSPSSPSKGVCVKWQLVPKNQQHALSVKFSFTVVGRSPPENSSQVFPSKASVPHLPPGAKELEFHRQNSLSEGLARLSI